MFSIAAAGARGGALFVLLMREEGARWDLEQVGAGVCVFMRGFVQVLPVFFIIRSLLVIVSLMHSGLSYSQPLSHSIFSSTDKMTLSFSAK